MGGSPFQQRGQARPTMDNKGRPPINLGGRKVIEKWVRENPGEPVVKKEGM